MGRKNKKVGDPEQDIDPIASASTVKFSIWMLIACAICAVALAVVVAFFCLLLSVGAANASDDTTVPQPTTEHICLIGEPAAINAARPCTVLSTSGFILGTGIVLADAAPVAVNDGESSTPPGPIPDSVGSIEAVEESYFFIIKQSIYKLFKVTPKSLESEPIDTSDTEGIDRMEDIDVLYPPVIEPDKPIEV